MDYIKRKYTTEKLPECWAVKAELDHPNWKDFMDFIKEESTSKNWTGDGENYYGKFNNSDYYNGYGYKGFKSEFDCDIFTLDQFLELTEPIEELPEKWYISIKDTKEAEIYRKFFNSKEEKAKNWRFLPDFIYGFDGKNYQSSQKTGKQITFEQFKKYVLKKEPLILGDSTNYNKIEPKMKEQFITKGELIDLYNANNCPDWREKITFYLEGVQYKKDDAKIKINPEVLRDLNKRGTSEQKKLVTDLGIILEENKNVFKKLLDKEGDISKINDLLFDKAPVFHVFKNAMKENDDIEYRALWISGAYKAELIPEGTGTVLKIERV